MGLLSWIFGRRAPQAETFDSVWLSGGGGDFDFDIVGESHYQKNLDAICGGRTEDGVYFKCVAALVPDPDNRHDANAVRVELVPDTGGNARQVGHLSRGDALEYSEQMEALGLSGRIGFCRAKIVGGWDRGKRDRGHFGVKLNLAWPIRIGRMPKSLA